MISYIIFLINVFDLYIIFNDFQCFFIDKNFIKDVLDFIVIIKYALYAFYKYILIKLHYYYLMIYTIFVLPHVPFLLFILKNFYVIKRTLV